MENCIPTSIWGLLSPFFLLIFCIIFSKNNKKKAPSSVRLPPGPSKLPIIGSHHHLIGDDAHRRLHDLSTKHGSVMHLQVGQTTIIVVSSSAMAKEFLHTHDIHFASKPQLFSAKMMLYGCTGIVFSSYGRHLNKLKNICRLELLSPKRVRAFASVREEEVANMIKYISNSSSSINLSELFYSLSNNILCRAAFGKECRQKDRIRRYLKEVFALISGFNYFDMLPSLEFTTMFTGMRWKLVRLHKKIDGILEEIISERLKEKKFDGAEDDEDLLDVLLRLHAHHSDDQDSFSLDTMKAVILDMFLGGTETSPNTLEWVMSELVANPRAMKKAQSEVRKVVGSSESKPDETTISQLKYMNLVIKENFRLHPPIPLLPRESTESCKVADEYDIPNKALLLVNVWSMGRDPNEWDNPNLFEPERFLESSINFKGSSFKLLPFGSGRRICPGIGFGMAVVELVLAELLRSFDWELPDGISEEEFDMSESYVGTLVRKSPLVLVAIPAVTM